MATIENMKSTFPADVEAWLRTNPGQHRPATVAAGLGVEAKRAADCLAYLARTGRVVRHKNPDRPNGPGSSTYSLT